MINKLYTKETKLGIGVFSSIDIDKNRPILEFSGELLSKKDIQNKKEDISKYVLQIHDNLFIGPSGQVDNYINHSCDPNSYMVIVGKRAFLYSLYMIPKDTEITFDYSISSLDGDYTNFNCGCKTSKCRGKISVFSSIDSRTAEFYKTNNLLPLFIKMKRK